MQKAPLSPSHRHTASASSSNLAVVLPKYKVPPIVMKGASTVETTIPDHNGFGSSNSSPVHGSPELFDIDNGNSNGSVHVGGRTIEEFEESKRGWFAYFKTKDFYIVLMLGYVNISSPVPRSCWDGSLFGDSDRSWHCALRQPIHSLDCWSRRERQSQHFRRSSITFF